MSANAQSCEFTVSKEELDGAILLVLSGELDIAAAPGFITDLRDVISQGKGPVILDVRDLDYVDSSGLGVLASTAGALKKAGRALVAFGCHGIFLRALQLSKLDRELGCFATLDEALQHASAAAAPG